MRASGSSFFPVVAKCAPSPLAGVAELRTSPHQAHCHLVLSPSLLRRVVASKPIRVYPSRVYPEARSPPRYTDSPSRAWHVTSIIADDNGDQSVHSSTLFH